jgi:dienelactone hydrolase
VPLLIAALELLLVAMTVLAQAPASKSTDGAQGLDPFLSEFHRGSTNQARELPPFLDDFLANREPPVVTQRIEIPSGPGRILAYWARVGRPEPLPAVVLAYDQSAWADWMEEGTRHLASIGYEVVTLNLEQRRLALNGVSTPPDEVSLARLSAAIRWLRGRSEVLPNRIGVVAWGWSGAQALALAAAQPVQACITCDAPLPMDGRLITGLRGTALLTVCGARSDELAMQRERSAGERIPGSWHVAAGQSPGFMGPLQSKAYNHDAAEDAWVAIYNFLEKHVEDARPAESAAKPLREIATIADIMRAVNEPAGVRGVLSKALEQPPASKREWQRIRANAALVAESGSWLQTRLPPKGPLAHWQKEGQAFTDAARALVDAADRRDYEAARKGLTLLASQCAACHTEHR